jgi:uncharacterized protein YdiU (UPF0061 family)
MSSHSPIVPEPAGWCLEHSYAQLPAVFFERVEPVAVREPRLVVFNRPLARSLGLEADVLERGKNAGLFTGNLLPDGAQPIAQAYAGHQFGHFTALGDGRAVLLGEQVTPDGGRFDIQLKGSGETPFSRRGDGRAALGPMLREYIISEAMHALGIPTTRSLAVATTGEVVAREQPLPGAVLTRVAASHLRVGTFEWASAQRDRGAVKAIADYTIRRHDPELFDHENPHAAFLDAVMERQAALVARWMLVGFIHGVMNTDNMALSGETIDYGPCAFMDAYDPATVFSSIDRGGRYAYANQPHIAQWNLARFAETLLPLLHADEAQAIDQATAAIHTFPARFQRHWLDGMRAKLGLFTGEEDDAALVDELLEWMQRLGADHTNTFRALSAADVVEAALPEDPAVRAWLDRWRARLARQPQSSADSLARRRAHNPVLIPRNHKVEEALEAATTRGDFSVLHRLLEALAAPYDHARDPGDFGEPPAPGACAYRTFCGT